jgi:hypothetical protein
MIPRRASIAAVVIASQLDDSSSRFDIVIAAQLDDFSSRI